MHAKELLFYSTNAAGRSMREGEANPFLSYFANGAISQSHQSRKLSYTKFYEQLTILKLFTNSIQLTILKIKIISVLIQRFAEPNRGLFSSCSYSLDIYEARVLMKFILLKGVTLSIGHCRYPFRNCQPRTDLASKRFISHIASN